MRRIRLFMAAAALILGLGMLAPVTALASTPKQDVCNTLTNNSSSDCSQTPAGSVSIGSLIKTVINLMSWAVGVVAVVMIIVGGFKYVTAAGDSNKLTSARNTLTYAIIGLVVVAFSQIFVQFVLNKL